MGLHKIYRGGYKYQKAGMMLSGLVAADNRQADLFGLASTDSRSSKLMKVIDWSNQYPYEQKYPEAGFWRIQAAVAHKTKKQKLRLHTLHGGMKLFVLENDYLLMVLIACL